VLAAAALGIAACGSDDNSASTATVPAAAPPSATVTAPDVTVESPGSTTATATATATTPATTTPSNGAASGPKSISKDLKRKPAIPKPSGKAPKRLVIRDIVKGTGKTAKAGSVVTVQYVGVDFKTGKQFDASWDAGQPFQFQLGAQSVIPGWDQGVAGMKVGGRRELIIPPDLAYGPQGQPPAIGPSATLVFVVDMVSVA
jgi:peptidylprolyl isomerase